MSLSLVRGLSFMFVMALVSIFIASLPSISQFHISSLTIAIIIGIWYGNIFHTETAREFTNQGIIYAQKKLLRLGIILFGARITFQEIYSVGIAGILFNLFVVSSIVIIGYIIGTKIFKLTPSLSFLISAGSGVCGAAAVLATEETSDAEPHEVATAIATVVIFGTIAMFAFPHIVQLLDMSDKQMGIALGATVHEVAQAVAAGNMINEEVTITAVIVKLARVMLLIPLLILATFFFIYIKSKKEKELIAKATGKKSSVLSFFPWFAILFVVVSGINSLNIVPQSIINFVNSLDNLLLTMAMCALGVETNLFKIKSLGIRPFALAGILMIMLTSYLFLIPMI